MQEALHPTPAVCGRPQADAYEFLQRHEPFDRGFYAGPFGVLSSSSAEFVVGIRSALVTPPEATPAAAPTRRVYLYAGVGVVHGSDADAEWRELNLKIGQFRRVLPAAPPFATLPNDNAVWAWLIVDELVRCGVTTFAVAPGSRSSPLTHAVCSHPCAEPLVCVDERSLAYWALGHAVATGHPAAVVTTSGTAVANLMPAVVEASMSGVPMVILSADRPAEMRATGANQTIDQVKIFGGYVRHAADVPPPEPHMRGAAALTAVDAAVRHATAPAAPGPVQINVQLREPLAPVPAPLSAGLTAHLRSWEARRSPYTAHHPPLPLTLGGADHRALPWDVLARAERGLLVVGELRSAADRGAARRVARCLGWPVAADVLSGLRVGAHEGGVAVVHHLDALLTDRVLAEGLRPDCVLQIGARLVSKRVAALLAAAAERGAPWLQVTERPHRHDEHHCVSHLVQLAPPQFAAALAQSPLRPRAQRTRFCERLCAADAAAAACLHTTVLQPLRGTPPSEPAVAMLLAQHLPDDHGLFVGSSMPIRDLDMFARGRARRGGSTGAGAPIASNRGASGIDGVLSSAAGFAAGLGQPTTLLVGDVSFLHDTNGLLCLHDRPQRAPLTVVLINNSGGGIFHFLPIAEAVGEGAHLRHCRIT